MVDRTVTRVSGNSCGSKTFRDYGRATEDSPYCRESGCFRRLEGVRDNEYCQEHLRTTSGVGYTYSYTGSYRSCPGTPGENCSRTLSDGQDYCNFCKETRDLIRRVESKTSINQVKDAKKFSTW